MKEALNVLTSLVEDDNEIGQDSGVAKNIKQDVTPSDVGSAITARGRRMLYNIYNIIIVNL